MNSSKAHYLSVRRLQLSHIQTANARFSTTRVELDPVTSGRENQIREDRLAPSLNTYTEARSIKR